MTSDLAELWLEAPSWFVALALGLFGLCLGSFLNVVIHRVPLRRSIVTPRSACPSCGRLIRWHENIPVLSWLLLRGRCAGCGVRISPRYAAVELLMAGLVLVAFWRFGPGRALPIAVLFSFLVVALIFIDFEKFLLPDAITLPGTFVGLALSFFSPFVTPADALLGCLIGLFVVEAVNFAHVLLRGFDGMGAGDTKMMMMMGAFLGLQLMLFAFLAACFAGAVVGVAWLVARRVLDRDTTRDEESAGDLPPAAGEAGEEQGGPVAGEDDAATAAAGSERGSPLLDLVPSRPEELIAPLTFVALLTSFFSWHVTPEAALIGLLAGVLLMLAVDLVRRRGAARSSRHVAGATELIPLGLSVSGLPPTPLSASLAAAVVAACLALSRPLRALLPRIAPPRPPAPDHSEDEAPVPAGALPFGVFLGIGALVALHGGREVIDWYLDTLSGAMGGAG